MDVGGVVLSLSEFGVVDRVDCCDVCDFGGVVVEE